MKYAKYNRNGFITSVVTEKPDDQNHYIFSDEIEIKSGDLFKYPNVITPDFDYSRKYLIELLYSTYSRKINSFMNRIVTAEESASWLSKIKEMDEYSKNGVFPSGGILESFNSYIPWDGAINISVNEYINLFNERMSQVLPMMGKLDKCLQTHLKTIQLLESKQEVIDYNLDIGWPI